MWELNPRPLACEASVITPTPTELGSAGLFSIYERCWQSKGYVDQGKKKKENSTGHGSQWATGHLLKFILIGSIKKNSQFGDRTPAYEANVLIHTVADAVIHTLAELPSAPPRFTIKRNISNK